MKSCLRWSNLQKCPSRPKLSRYRLCPEELLLACSQQSRVGHRRGVRANIRSWKSSPATGTIPRESTRSSWRGRCEMPTLGCWNSSESSAAADHATSLRRRSEGRRLMWLQPWGPGGCCRGSFQPNAAQMTAWPSLTCRRCLSQWTRVASCRCWCPSRRWTSSMTLGVPKTASKSRSIFDCQ